MKKAAIIFIVLTCYSCGADSSRNDNKEEETNSDSIPEAKIQLAEHHPCSFKITLPDYFELAKMYEDNSPDYCDYDVKTNIKGLRFEIHSMLKSRFSVSDLNELFQLDTSEINFRVTGSKIFENGYFISGRNEENYVYYLRKIGIEFISDFYLEYPKEAESDVDMLIAGLYYKFESD